MKVTVIFSLAPKICYSLGVIVVIVGCRITVIDIQKLTFCNSSVITEDNYLKLGLCVQYPNNNPYYQVTIQNAFFFSRVMLLFSSAVFGENPRYCYSLGVAGVMQKLTICNISHSTETQNICSLSKEQSFQGRQFKMLFFFLFQNYASFST